MLTTAWPAVHSSLCFYKLWFYQTYMHKNRHVYAFVCWFSRLLLWWETEPAAQTTGKSAKAGLARSLISTAVVALVRSGDRNTAVSRSVVTPHFPTVQLCCAVKQTGGKHQNELLNPDVMHFIWLIQTIFWQCSRSRMNSVFPWFLHVSEVKQRGQCLVKDVGKPVPLLSSA